MRLPRATAGAPIPAEWWNQLVAAIEAIYRSSGPDLFIDGTGIHLRRRSVRQAAVVVKITGAEEGGEKYAARIVTPSNLGDVSLSDDLAMPEGVAVPEQDNAVYFNLAGNGSADHSLAADAWVAGVHVGYLADGRALVMGGGGGAGVGLFVQITGYSTIPGVTNRWEYSWIEVEPDELGTWAAKPGGLTSAGGTPAYNSVEANNSETGMQGNSVTAEEATIRPIQGNPVVFAHPMIDCNGNPFLSFQLPNAAAGSCSTEEE